jgi:hypothetical protein
MGAAQPLEKRGDGGFKTAKQQTSRQHRTDERQRQRQRDREAQRQRQRHRHRDTETRDRQRQTDRQTDRQTERQTESRKLMAIDRLPYHEQHQ